MHQFNTPIEVLYTGCPQFLTIASQKSFLFSAEKAFLDGADARKQEKRAKKLRGERIRNRFVICFGQELIALSCFEVASAETGCVWGDWVICLHLFLVSGSIFGC
jgi:hypothetical protein